MGARKMAAQFKAYPTAYIGLCAVSCLAQPWQKGCKHCGTTWFPCRSKLWRNDQAAKRNKGWDWYPLATGPISKRLIPDMGRQAPDGKGSSVGRWTRSEIHWSQVGGSRAHPRRDNAGGKQSRRGRASGANRCLSVSTWPHQWQESAWSAHLALKLSVNHPPINPSRYARPGHRLTTGAELSELRLSPHAKWTRIDGGAWSPCTRMQSPATGDCKSKGSPVASSSHWPFKVSWFRLSSAWNH